MWTVRSLIPAAEPRQQLRPALERVRSEPRPRRPSSAGPTQGPAFSLRATQPDPLATPSPEKLAGPALSRSPPRGLAERIVPAPPDSGGLTHQWPVQNAGQQAIPAVTNYKAPAVVPAPLWTLRTLPVIPV